MTTDFDADFEMLSLAAVTRNVIEFLMTAPCAKETTPAARFGGEGMAAGALPSLERPDGTVLMMNSWMVDPQGTQIQRPLSVTNVAGFSRQASQSARVCRKIIASPTKVEWVGWSK